MFREDWFCRDIEDLQKRYQAGERRHEESITQVPESTRPLLWNIEVKVERLNQLKASRMQETSQCRKLEIPNLLFSI